MGKQHTWRQAPLLACSAILLMATVAQGLKPPGGFWWDIMDWLFPRARPHWPELDPEVVHAALGPMPRHYGDPEGPRLAAQARHAHAHQRPGWRWQQHFQEQYEEARLSLTPEQWDAVHSTHLVAPFSYADRHDRQGFSRQVGRLLDEQHVQFQFGVPASAAPASSFNDSTLIPLIPVSWADQMSKAEALVGKGSDLWTKAQLMAQLTSLTYCGFDAVTAWNCSRRIEALKLGRLGQTKLVYDAGWDLFAYVGLSQQLRIKEGGTTRTVGLDAIVVAFRGTDSHSWYNWAENMKYWRAKYQMPYPGSEGSLVHSGFFSSYNNSALAPNITAEVKRLAALFPDLPLYIGGHSMGAAMAHMCALDLRYNANMSRVHVYTYGSPRVGNTQFYDFFNASVEVSVRVTHNRDIVPSVPLQIMGFHHVPNEIWQVEDPILPWIPPSMPYLVCEGNEDYEPGESPICHNSMCYLGLCTSIVDHMQYMGAPMFHDHSADR